MVFWLGVFLFSSISKELCLCMMCKVPDLSIMSHFISRSSLFFFSNSLWLWHLVITTLCSSMLAYTCSLSSSVIQSHLWVLLECLLLTYHIYSNFQFLILTEYYYMNRSSFLFSIFMFTLITGLHVNTLKIGNTHKLSVYHLYFKNWEMACILDWNIGKYSNKP